MLFQQEDLEALSKLRVSDLLSLALIAPSSYDVNILKNTPDIGNENLVEAEVISIKSSPKVLNIKIFAVNFGFDMEVVIFNYTTWHKKIFLEKHIFIRGKITLNANSLQISNPKKVSHIGIIIPKYKTLLQNKTVINLIKKYVTILNLEETKLPKKIAQFLYQIHNPTILSIMDKENNIYSKDELYALKFTEIFRHLKYLRSKKRDIKSLYKIDSNPIEFISKLPFDLTNDQISVIKEIQKDLNSITQSRRVIIGDVGCGKTVVILATAFMAKKQKSVLMVPTTILAQQIYEEAIKFLPKEMKIELVLKNSKNKDLNSADFILGTHALLYIDLPKCGVVMIDEQHRFGTNQRKLLSQLVANETLSPHFFQFSATPIPRTQALIESTLVDVSMIKELPFKKDITSKIIGKSDFKDLIIHIKNEIKNKRQVLVIYPLVEASENFNYQSLEEAKNYWMTNFENVYFTHGKDKEKEQVLYDFRQNGDILLATTVVEVGISLPKLSTIVISGAERLGLATLHQLRGRVSRTGLKGYCFLYTNSPKNERLIELSKTISGFDVAELDLKYRNSGDLVQGTIQSGKNFEFFDMVEDFEIIKEAKNELLN